MAELQFSGSRRDLAAEKGRGASAGLAVVVGVMMEKGKNREKRGRVSRVVFKNE